MGIITKIIYVCDVCKKECFAKEEENETHIQIIDYNPNPPHSPHFQMKTLILCKQCKDHAFEGYYLENGWGEGLRWKIKKT